jgi:hypothetical protein
MQDSGNSFEANRPIVPVGLLFLFAFVEYHIPAFITGQPEAVLESGYENFIVGYG